MKNKKFVALILAVVVVLSAVPSVVMESVGRLVRVLVEPTLVFDSVYAFRDGISWVQRDGKVGFVNQHGEIIIPLEFDLASVFFHEGLAFVANGNRQTGFTYRYIDKSGNFVFGDMQFSSAEHFRNGFARVTVNGRVGVINREGEFVIPPVYGRIIEIRNELAIVSYSSVWDAMVGIIDLNGDIVLPIEYSNLFFFDDLIIARRGDWIDGVMGAYDRNGNIVIPFEYNNLSTLWNRDGLIIAKIGGGDDSLSGIIDSHGNVVLPIVYSRLSIRDNYIIAEKDGRAGMIDIYGNIIVPFEFDNVESFHEGLAAVSRDGMVGFVNKYGELVVPFRNGVLGARYGYAPPRAGGPFSFWHHGGFEDGLAVISENELMNDIWRNTEALVATGSRLGLIDREGNVILPFEYDFIWPFTEGLARVGRRKTDITNSFGWEYIYGVIDMNGNIVVPLEYSWIGSFYEGVAPARRDGKAGLIDSSGNVVIPFEYDWVQRIHPWQETVTHVEPGVVLARRDGRTKLLDIFGNVILSDKYDSMWWNSADGLFHVRIDEKHGLIDINGNIMAPVEFNSIRRFGNDMWIAERDGETVVINNDGTVIIPCAHEVYHISFRRHGNQSWGLFEVNFIEIDGEVHRMLPTQGMHPITRDGTVFLIYEDGLFGIIDIDFQSLSNIELTTTEDPDHYLPYYETGYASEGMDDAESNENEGNGIGTGVIILLAAGGVMFVIGAFFVIRMLYRKSS